MTFTVRFGVHRGTWISRDVCDPIQAPIEEEALEELMAEKRHFAGLGCYVWFATLVHPDGREIQVPGVTTPYR